MNRLVHISERSLSINSYQHGHSYPNWNLLQGTELLDSPVRTEFSTGSFCAVFI